jgi:hypothetical protein
VAFVAAVAASVGIHPLSSGNITNAGARNFIMVFHPSVFDRSPPLVTFPTLSGGDPIPGDSSHTCAKNMIYAAASFGLGLAERRASAPLTKSGAPAWQWVDSEGPVWIGRIRRTWSSNRTTVCDPP